MRQDLTLTPKDLVALIYQSEDEELAEKIVGIYTEQQVYLSSRNRVVLEKPTKD